VAAVPIAAPRAAPGEHLLDRATLDALRALPPRGGEDMLSRIAGGWLADSQRLLGSIERALGSGDAAELARAAHAWRSCNGHVGAFGLMTLCRELETCARSGDLRTAPALLAQARLQYQRVSDELQGEIRRSA
jgi:HPt (histidine-containing phosphotransfer) domain-containing protein